MMSGGVSGAVWCSAITSVSLCRSAVWWKVMMISKLQLPGDVETFHAAETNYKSIILDHNQTSMVLTPGL